jgi:hypothetical protein
MPRPRGSAQAFFQSKETKHMNEMKLSSHGHHKISAAIFVGLLLVGCAIILAAELMKPARYEYHQLAEQGNYLIYDRDSGRATITPIDSKTPLAAFDR